MKRFILLALFLGLSFTSHAASSNPYELLEGSKPKDGFPSTIKDITLSEPMDDTMVDMEAALAGEEIVVSMSLAQCLAMDESTIGLNIAVAKKANGYIPYLSKLITTLPQLNHLSYSTKVLYEIEGDIVSRCSNLTSLELYFTVCDNFLHPKPFLSGLKKLETLSLITPEFLDCRILKEVASLPSLRALAISNLDHNGTLHTCGGHRCIEQLSHLSQLSVTVFDPDWQLKRIYPEWLPDREKYMCKPSLPSLTYFSLSLGEGDVDHELQYFVPDSPLLTNLHLTALDHTANLTEAGCKWLIQIKGLKKLRLDNIVATDQVIMLANLPNLKSLQVRLHMDFLSQKDDIRAAFKEKQPEYDLSFLSDN